MKGERTIDDKPFRYGGIMHDYDSTSEELTTTTAQTAVQRWMREQNEIDD